MKIYRFIALIILIIPLLSGCWSREEVNSLGIVTAAGLDLTSEQQIRLSMQFAVPRLLGAGSTGGLGGSKLESESTWTVSGTGETILEAFRNAQAKLPRKIFFYHSQIIIIGEKLARKGVAPLLDFFERNRQSQYRNIILITKGDTDKIFSFKPKFDKLTSNSLRGLNKTSITETVRLRDFINMLQSEGIEPSVARIGVVPSVEKEDSPVEDNAKYNLVSLGSAVFKQDKLIGWLDDRETRGLMWLRNELKQGVLTVTIPEEKGGGRISLFILYSATKVTPILNGDQSKISINVKVRGEIYENQSQLDLSDPEAIRYIKGLLAKETTATIQLACTKVQKELKSDIFGFGNAFYRNNPAQWKQSYKKHWETWFTSLEVQITSNVSIVGSGLINKPIKKQDMGEEQE